MPQDDNDKNEMSTPNSINELKEALQLERQQAKEQRRAMCVLVAHLIERYCGGEVEIDPREMDKLLDNPPRIKHTAAPDVEGGKVKFRVVKRKPVKWADLKAFTTEQEKQP